MLSFYFSFQLSNFSTSAYLSFYLFQLTKVTQVTLTVSTVKENKLLHKYGSCSSYVATL